MRFRRIVAAVCLTCALPAALAQAPPSGGAVFDSACAHCHGANGEGGPLAPSLLMRVAESDDAELTAFLRVGAPERGMPPAPVTGEQMTALVDYLRFLGSAAESSSRGADDVLPGAAVAIESFRPVTEAVLRDPDDADWLGPARVRNGRPFTPLDQVTAANVERLALAWARGLPSGPAIAEPIVHDGVMFVAMPDASVAALDAATGDVLWEHRRSDDSAEAGSSVAVRSLSLFGQSLYVTPDGAMPFALDARSGALQPEPASETASRAARQVSSPGGSTLETAGGLIFRGEDRRYEAVDAESEAVLWQTILGGSIVTGGISYAVDGRQYVAVIAGGVQRSAAPAPREAESGDDVLDAAPAALYVFALRHGEGQDQR